jgi:ribonuclease BN (tRNA processing enzyme)
MKITLLPSAVGDVPAPAPQYLSTALINDTIALDAGCLGLHGTPEQQAQIRHVLLTHSHLDHVATLPIFLENAYEGRADGVNIYAGSETLDWLRAHLFNDRIWPDFVALSPEDRPFLHLVPFEAGQTIELNGLHITAVALDHVVPVHGFLIRDAEASIVFVTDTAPTDVIWHAANALPNLKAVFLEATFPNELAWLAKVSKHLTPTTFAGEVRKLAQPVRIVAMHLKARYRGEIAAQLQALGIAELELARFGMPYLF